MSFTEAAFAYARDLVDRADYPNVSAAVSGERARARASRQRDQALLEAEVTRCLDLPREQWDPLDNLDDLTAAAVARIEDLERDSETRAHRA